MGAQTSTSCASCNNSCAKRDPTELANTQGHTTRGLGPLGLTTSMYTDIKTAKQGDRVRDKVDPNKVGTVVGIDAGGSLTIRWDPTPSPLVTTIPAYNGGVPARYIAPPQYVAAPQTTYRAPSPPPNFPRTLSHVSGKSMITGKNVDDIKSTNDKLKDEIQDAKRHADVLEEQRKLQMELAQLQHRIALAGPQNADKETTQRLREEVAEARMQVELVEENHKLHSELSQINHKVNALETVPAPMVRMTPYSAFPVSNAVTRTASPQPVRYVQTGQPIPTSALPTVVPSYVGTMP